MPRHPTASARPHLRPGTGLALLLPFSVLVLLSLIWGVALHLIRVEYANATRDASNSTRDLAGIYEIQMMRALREIDLTLGLVRYASEHRGLDAGLPELEREVLLPSSLILAISVADAHGKIVAFNHSGESQSIAGQPHFAYFQQARLGDELYVGPASPNPTTQMRRLHFSRRISLPDGKFAGVVSVTIDLDYFTSAYDKTRMGEHGVVGVLNAEGQFLVRRSGDQLFWESTPHRTAKLPTSVHDIEEPVLEVNPWDGEKRYTVLQALRAFPFAIVVGLSEQEQLSAFRARERSYLWQAGAASGLLLLLGMLLWLLGRSQLRTRKAQATHHAASEASLDANLVLHSVTDSTGYIRDFIVTDVNKRALELTGMTKNAMLGKTLSSLVPELHYRAVFKTLTVVARTGERYDMEWQNDEPSVRAEWLHAQVVRAADGVVAIVRDISERKRFEAELVQRNAELTGLNNELTALNSELTQAQEQLVQSEKLASIGLLAAGVAHEINNPVGFVLSNIGTLDGYIASLFKLLDAYQQAEALLPDPEAIKHIETLRQQIELDYLREDIPALMRETKDGIARVRKIVHDLKNFSRVDSAQEWQTVDLHEGIDSTLNVVNNEIKYKADVVKEYGDMPPVECLPSEINQVVMNLAVNAAHAIAERGTITIRTGHQGEGPDGEAWFEVADTGCGISPENLAKIFDPFFTTKPVGKGTGLGLSLSYGIIKKHNGRLDVSSELDKGSTFRVTLPLRRSVNQSATA